MLRVMMMGFVLVILMAPTMLDSLSIARARQTLEESAASERQFMGADGAARGPRDALARLPQVNAALGLGLSLTDAVSAVVIQCAHCGLKVTSTRVSRATEIRCDGDKGPVPWLKEYPVRFSLKGTTAAVMTFLQHWSDSKLPIRIETVSVEDLPAPDSESSQLQINVKVLTPTTPEV